ncbi:MAG: transglycosylase SLT domain-containing protein, partial [Pseudonocardiaceae bacterium]
MANRQTWLWALLGIAGAGYWLSRASSGAGNSASTGISSDATNFTTDPLAAVSDLVTSAVQGWKSTGSAAAWLPTLASVESSLGIPTDLLARMAYQESHFREEIIRGTKTSSAGALGILQMLPQYFQSVVAPIPYSDAAVAAQIEEAGNYLSTLYHQFGDWSLAVAAYNAGPGNV